MLNGKAPALLILIVAIVILAVTPQPMFAQFIPCKIVNLNVVPPGLVQAGQSFQVSTNLTVSCDPSVLPIVRVDLVDASSSVTLSTNSVPYYPSSSSFLASVVNQATAPQLTGSWAMQVQVTVLSSLNGQSVASTTQLFQVNVEPYTPPVTEVQTTATTATTTQTSNASFVVSTQLFSATIALENPTEATTSSQLFVNSQTTSNPTDQLFVPAAILLAGVLIFGLLILAGKRRNRKSTPMKHCGQCGAELNHNEKFCTSCGAKQAK